MNSLNKVTTSTSNFSSPIKARSFNNVIAQYLASLSKYPLLKHDKVIELFKILDKDSGASLSMKKAARKKLIESNLRLVISIARKYQFHGLPLEDLIQEGNIGLMKAIDDHFRWEKGYRFSTYARWWIIQSINEYVLKAKRMIRLPPHAATIQRKLMAEAEKYREKFGTEPTIDELANLTGSSKKVASATMHAGKGTISLQKPAFKNQDGSVSLIQDVIKDDRENLNPFARISSKELLKVTLEVLGTLSKKEETIIRLRFGLTDCSPQDYPITDDEISQVESGKNFQ